MQQNQVRSIVYSLQQNIRRVIVGKDETIELALIALLCKGHVLIEDVPGVGKTTLVAALARSLSCSFKRIQFTPDVTPSDITGFTMPSLQTGEMEYKSGAVMSQIVLADEINRTSPKTQSSLLEVMEEGQVTVDGVTRPVPAPFTVIATQNPIGAAGTQMLPQSQLDRFMVCAVMGYPDEEAELAILAGQSKGRLLDRVRPVAGQADLLAMQQARRRTLLAALACLAAMISLVLAGRALLSAPAVPASAAISYTVQSENDRLVIRQSDGSVLRTGIDTRTLPSAEQQALADGITLDNAEELAHLLENYSS